MRSDRVSRCAAFAFVLAAFALAGCGTRGATPAGPRVEGAWLRPALAGQGTAGYFTLVNGSADSLVLVGVGVPAAEQAMMHETVRENGMFSMREAARFAVAPHGTLRFAPGGNHVMVMRLRAALAEGDTVALVLRFAGGDSLAASASVHD